MFLVTGGAGFIGSHLVIRLIAQGAAIRVFDNFSTGKIRNLDSIAEHFDLVEGDVRDPDAVRRAVKGASLIFHLAAQSSAGRSIEDQRTTLEVNITGTLNVLEAARAVGCQRVVLASSAAVYGDLPELPKSEAMTPRPLSPYGISKLAAEQLSSVFTRTHQLETVALRYFNVFGPRQPLFLTRDSAFIPRVLNALETGASPIVYGDGEQARDFIYVDDVVDASLCAAFAPEAAGHVFNIARGEATTLRELLRLLADITGVDVRPRHVPSRAGDIRHSVADITEAKKILRYTAQTPLDVGLMRTVTAFQGDRSGGTQSSDWK